MTNKRKELSAFNIFCWALTLILTTLIMRAPMMAVGPLSVEIQEFLSINAFEFGLLTSLPVFCLGFLSWGAPKLVEKFDFKLACFFTVLVITLGSFMRMSNLTSIFFFGTILIGGGIALLNVVIPSLIKAQFLNKASLVLGFYVSLIGLSGGIGGVTSIPLLHFTESLPITLSIWGVVGLVAFLFWIITPVVKASEDGASENQFKETIKERLAKPLLWFMMLVMSLQSLEVYAVAAWLPEFLQDNGYSKIEAGNLLFLFLVAGVPASMIMGWWFNRVEKETSIVITLALAYFAGFIMWLASPSLAYLAAIVGGAAQGAMLSAALIFFARKSRSTAEMVWVSTFGHGCGYMIASIGPTVVGVLKHTTGSWFAPFVFLAVITLVWGFFGILVSNKKSM